jgi:hypothetical protein
MIAEELRVALGGEHAQALADGVLAAEPGLVLEPVGELRACVDAALGGLVIEQLEDDVVLAPALGVELLATSLRTSRSPRRSISTHRPSTLSTILGPIAGPFLSSKNSLRSGRSSSGRQIRMPLV